MLKVCLFAMVLLATAVVCPAQVTFTEYPIPTGGSNTYGITGGPDGNVWFTEVNANKIGRITTAGMITEFLVPTGSAQPAGITTGPDGNLWFTEANGNKIGTITPTGAITEFPIPTGGSVPSQITAGPDGNLWFAENGVGNIGRITTTGIITEFPIPTVHGGAVAITKGPDGNLWFAEYFDDKIGRITTAGAVTAYPLPTSGTSINGITTGPDGNLWFAEYGTDKIGRITTTGIITEYSVPSGGGPVEITAGPDGNLWFTVQVGKIVKITITPLYSLCLLYDSTKAVKSGSTIPIKLQLCDSNGHDSSSPSITAHAISITQTSNSISGPVQDSGNANPDNDFRFDATLGSTGGYIFNLSTKGLVTGTYNLNFTVTGDTFVYAAPFQVK